MRKTSFAFPQTVSSNGHCDGYAKNCVTVEHRDPETECGDLVVEVPRNEASAKEFDEVQPLTGTLFPKVGVFARCNNRVGLLK
ncbi:MAG: hypothetical protein MJH10_13505 [Epibacterium sp.]|nr:hypothetical protein [Epibacterium sp.]NQX74553.1 hypothetical protein [Epibacterium sp.]